jgi:hypothetical protein
MRGRWVAVAGAAAILVIVNRRAEDKQKAAEVLAGAHD